MHRFLVALVLWLWPVLSLAKVIVLFHTSDVHGGLLSRPGEGGAQVGGYAALAAVVRAEASPWALLDSGDVFQGTPEGNLTRGDASIEAMNAVGYAAMAIGNHELDYGEANLARLAAAARFPLLGANVVRRSDGKRVDYAKPSVLLTIGGVRVGVIGIATRHTATATLPANVRALRFRSETQVAVAEAKRLRAAGATVIVALTHCGLAPSVARKRLAAADLRLNATDEAYRGDLAIARTGAVDLVLGGHLHTALDAPYVDARSRVPIVQSGANLTTVSRLDLTVDDATGHLTSVAGRLVDLRVAETGEDPAVLALVRRVHAEVGAALDQPIGEAAEDVARIEPGFDSPLGSFIADAMREAAGTPIGVQNSFGIRADFRKGPLTLRSVYEVMPFDNTLVVIDIAGRDLERFVRDNLRFDRSSIQVSGLELRVRRDGEKVTEVTVLAGGARLSPSRRYRIATNNYIAAGGTGGRALARGRIVDTGRSLRDVVEQAVRRASPLRAPPVGRIQLSP